MSPFPSCLFCSFFLLFFPSQIAPVLTCTLPVCFMHRSLQSERKNAFYLDLIFFLLWGQKQCKGNKQSDREVDFQEPWLISEQTKVYIHPHRDACHAGMKCPWRFLFCPPSLIHVSSRELYLLCRIPVLPVTQWYGRRPLQTQACDLLDPLVQEVFQRQVYENGHLL